MHQPMSEDLIRYDILTQDALRQMIAKLLDEVARTGLPGDHHFFITFDTCAPNVQLSSRMKEKYPEEMTIVVQHRFWDLEVKDGGFQIGLSFDEIPELLKIPFAAVKGFYDPSVKFGLQFEVQVEEATAEESKTTPSLVKKPTLAASAATTAATNTAGEKQKKKRKSSKKQKAKPELFEDAPDEPVKSSASKKSPDDKDADKNSEPGGARVVSLDSFRKKR
jgi:hypothetical protein